MPRCGRGIRDESIHEMKTAPLDDICRNRHSGNANSIRVNPSAAFKKRDRSKVYETIKRCGTGITSKEIAKLMDRRLNCISGRISELKQAGLVKVDGRRGDCGILYVER